MAIGAVEEELVDKASMGGGFIFKEGQGVVEASQGKGRRVSSKKWGRSFANGRAKAAAEMKVVKASKGEGISWIGGANGLQGGGRPGSTTMLASSTPLPGRRRKWR